MQLFVLLTRYRTRQSNGEEKLTNTNWPLSGRFELISLVLDFLTPSARNSISLTLNITSSNNLSAGLNKIPTGQHRAANKNRNTDRTVFKSAITGPSTYFTITGLLAGGIGIKGEIPVPLSLQSLNFSIKKYLTYT
ncbi:hypothetical protein OGATHE_003482 [Ogataea polymorpha]|uniref:Uncharacterized protein n=1 Tax=Ogataea polymorpha TaxID=460523 RepID=A0A9P8P3S0_9ASCO|nr:hypothetical protein OGATHE_003482 [Ogataea polymorpha]